MTAVRHPALTGGNWGGIGGIATVRRVSVTLWQLSRQLYCEGKCTNSSFAGRGLRFENRRAKRRNLQVPRLFRRVPEPIDETYGRPLAGGLAECLDGSNGNRLTKSMPCDPHGGAKAIRPAVTHRQG
jgi:hypothetical protein